MNDFHLIPYGQISTFKDLTGWYNLLQGWKFYFQPIFYARILLFTAVFGQSFCVLCKISFILFKVYSGESPMPMSFVPIKITRFFGLMFKALHSNLSNNLSLSTANNPAPIAPQNSGLSDMKIFVFNRFCNTFFKNMFSGRWNSPPWLATKPKNRIIFKAFALFWAEAFFMRLFWLPAGTVYRF